MSTELSYFCTGYTFRKIKNTRRFKELKSDKIPIMMFYMSNILNSPPGISGNESIGKIFLKGEIQKLEWAIMVWIPYKIRV